MTAEPDVVELTRSLVAMDTINPPGNEAGCTNHLGALLDDAGFLVHYAEFAPGRSSLVARSPDPGEGPPLCLTGHVDTVPLGNEPWSVDPFAGEERDGRLYGRGSTDMKGGVAAFVVAAIRLAGRLTGTAGVTLVLTGGEETGCDGAKALCETPDLLGEAGAILVGEPTSNRPLIGHKGALWLRGVSRGVTAHGSTPELGINAVYAACRAVGKIADFGFNIRPHEILGSPSINVGRMKGGINVNSVPDYAEFDVDIRTIPSQDHAEIRAMLAQYLGEDVELSPSVDVDGVVSSVDHPWIGEAFSCLEPFLGERPSVATAAYFTDASVLTPAYGYPPTIILGPGDPAIAHKTDEYCEIDKLREAVDIYAALVGRWCGLS